MNAHNESDILAALEQSPQVREAVAAMLAALGEAWGMDIGDEHDTLEIEFSNLQKALDCESAIDAANKVLDHWIMKESEDA